MGLVPLLLPSRAKSQGSGEDMLPFQQKELGQEGPGGGKISLSSAGSSGPVAFCAQGVAGSLSQRDEDSPIFSGCCCPLTCSHRSAIPAGTSEHDKLCRARDQCRDILKYVNEAVKQAENRHRLEGYQKRLDATSLERTSNPLAAEFKVASAPGQRWATGRGLPGPSPHSSPPSASHRAWTSPPGA